MTTEFVGASLSVTARLQECKLFAPKIPARRLARWGSHHSSTCPTGCTCILQQSCAHAATAAIAPLCPLGSHAAGLQRPLPPVPFVTAKVSLTNTAQGASKTALHSTEPIGTVTQDCTIRHRHILPDGAQLELLEISPPESAQQGQAQPHLLFVHGASHGAWCWAEKFLPWLAQHGHHCFAVSLRGHGSSSNQSNSVSDTFAQSSDDLSHVIASFPQPPVLVAHSFGGFFAQRYLIEMADKKEMPAVSGVVMMASASLTSYIPNMQWWHAQQSSMHAVKVIWWMMTSTVFKNASIDKEMLFSSDLPNSDFDRYYEQLRSGQQVLPASGKELRRYVAKAKACAEAVKQLPVPVGVMIAGDDALIMRHQVEANARYFGVEPVVLPGVAHDLMLDTRWEVAAQALDTWLQGVGKAEGEK